VVPVDWFPAQWHSILSKTGSHLRPLPPPRRRTRMDTPSSTMSLEHKPKPRWIDNLRNLHVPIIRHLKKHTGVGLVCAVAYFDPCVFLLALVIQVLTSSLEEIGESIFKQALSSDIDCFSSSCWLAFSPSFCKSWQVVWAA